MNQHHDTQTTDVTADTAVQPKEQAPGLSRRKFLTRAGVGSLPVIMSIKSGSAFGCVDLKCTPGENSLSNSGSAVASATSTTDGRPAAYQKPDWSSIKVIKDVFKIDFNDWLLITYEKDLFVKGQFGYQPVTKTDGIVWWETVRTRKCFTKTTELNTKTQQYVDKYSEFKGTRRMPAMHNSVVLLNDTELSAVFGTGLASVNFLSSLESHDTLEQYLVAAFIGSVWERHPEYIRQFGNRKPCYPTPQELIDAFQNARFRQDGLKDLYSLLKFYTIGAR
jgi:hypothetical protein